MMLEGEILESDWAEFRRRRIAGDLALGVPAEAAAAAAARAERQARARLEWLEERCARAARLWAYLGRYWADFAAAHPEIDLIDPDDDARLPDPPEQSELESVEAEIAAARDQDIWPRHLYSGEV